MRSPQLIAVDTNVLLDLAADDETVWDCLNTIRKRLPQVRLVVLPTVIQELADISERSNTSAGKLALAALSQIIQWGFVPLNCIPVGHGIVEETARKIRQAGLLPDEEINDSFVIAESALANCNLLISSDSHIRDIDQRELDGILQACDLEKPVITSPWYIVNQFFR